MRDSAYIGIVD